MSDKELDGSVSDSYVWTYLLGYTLGSYALGYYTLALLSPGIYRIRVERDGFQSGENGRDDDVAVVCVGDERL